MDEQYFSRSIQAASFVAENFSPQIRRVFLPATRACTHCLNAAAAILYPVTRKSVN